MADASSPDDENDDDDVGDFEDVDDCDDYGDCDDLDNYDDYDLLLFTSTVAEVLSFAAIAESIVAFTGP